MEGQHREEVNTATRIKVRLYLHLSEQWHFCFDISLLSTPRHCPCSKMIEPRQRSGFYHELVFYPPWLKCKTPLWSQNTRAKRSYRGEWVKCYTNCKSLPLCRKRLCSGVTVCVALLSDRDLLTCRDREKADCTVTLLHRYPLVPLGKSQKSKERGRERKRDVGVLCINVQGKKREKKKKLKASIQMTKSECIEAENALLVPLPPAIMTPLYQMASQPQMFPLCVI